MSCTAEEIAEKRRQAKERLKQRKASTQILINSNNATSPGTSTKVTSSFYGSINAEKANELNSYENKMKNQSHQTYNNRISSQPYPRETNSSHDALNIKSNISQKTAPVFGQQVVTCKCSMISPNRFQVTHKGYHPKLIDIFKTIPSRAYNVDEKIWSFDLSAYDEVQKKVSALNPTVVIGHIPSFVLKLLREEKKELDFLCLQGIEKRLTSQLYDFQKYGVAFGINNNGRCMIADDMGLGKTYQAIAIADFYRYDWPLLVITTAVARGSWKSYIENLLPAVPSDSIKVLKSTNEYVCGYKVLITSYSLMDKNVDLLLKKSFGCVILDESHMIKNFKTKSAQSSKRLCDKAKRIILLTGTPALSRPAELYVQLELIDPKFFGSFKAYAERYCDAKTTNFGLDSSGSSNLKELNIILQRKFMIRRTKDSVQFEMTSKTRETILLDSGKVWNMNDKSMRETIENCKEYTADIEKLKGDKRQEVLTRLYGETAILKANAVCAYVNDLVKQKVKFIIFGHHKIMLDAISNCLTASGVNFIRIDGTTRQDIRDEYINRFQKNETCKVAVLSLKACNAAITLTAASLVIFAELDWNPSTLAQCESRAHRIGQKEAVVCRYLLAKGTVDDYMWNMVKQKQNVLNKAGIFSEDLSDATHSTVSISGEVPLKKTIINYFERQDKDSKQDPKSNSNNNNNETDSKLENKGIDDKSQSMDYHDILDGDDDIDDAMLGLDF